MTHGARADARVFPAPPERLAYLVGAGASLPAPSALPTAAILIERLVGALTDDAELFSVVAGLERETWFEWKFTATELPMGAQ